VFGHVTADALAAAGDGVATDGARSWDAAATAEGWLVGALVVEPHAASTIAAARHTSVERGIEMSSCRA
jgi:hypothetical protein